MKKVLKIVKPLVGTILFLALMSTLLIPMNNLTRTFDDVSIVNSQIRIREFYEQEEESLDVVYIGSSAVYRYFIPPQTWGEQNFTSWVYASVGQPFQMTKYVMEEVEKTQSPQLYVVDMRQLVKKMEDELDNKPLSEGKQEYYYNSLYTAMPFSWTRTKSIFASVAEDPITWVFDFSRHHSSWKDLKLRSVAKRLLVSDPYKNYDGYADYYATNCVAASAAYTVYERPQLDAVTERLPLTDTFKRTLDETLAYVRKENLPVLFISTPFVEKKRQRKIHNQLEDYFKDSGYTYINFNKHIDDIGIDYTEDFSDKKHLNVVGQEKFTRYISAYIKENYNIQSNHTESVTKSWDKALKNWNDKAKPMKEEVKQKVARKKAKED